MIGAAYCSKELCEMLTRKGIEARFSMKFERGGAWSKRYTLDVASRWLREERGYYISVRPRIVEGRVMLRADVDYMSKYGSFVTCIAIEKHSYEESLEAAIRYCVENLI